ncbi:ribonuclease h-like protein [Stemphylium lycopersici]|uniref:Ribonuclease h-like protein n=1 Tax=Stemphylium lycopersici TaxID=183478 RepID=A0A364MRB8_STELY|nr:ribonuclease h-like protein [Stemphylium lycopersici]RAQ99241.1 ribonuclease h-like protein [Stemphylium lycopersici]
MDAHGVVQDFVLGLPELPGQHSGVNIASVVATTLTKFRVNKDSVGYFVLDNAYNNDTAVASLADLYGFGAPERRLRCCCHILNLAAQVIIWGKDRDAFENDGGNLEDEEQFMQDWRKYGPIGVLFDIIASICTPQSRQLLQRLQQEQADALREPVALKDLVKPVKTRWNSYYAAFARAVELQGPLDSYVEIKIGENRHAEATTRRARRPGVRELAPPRLFLREGGLDAGNWATINEYMKLLAPFAEATKLLEGRGKHGRHGAIWEYYAKFDNAPVYYAATILYPHYKHHLDALWAVLDDHNTARDGPHYREGWLKNNHRAFLLLWKTYKDKTRSAPSSSTSSDDERPSKKPRVAGPTESRSAFLKSQLEAADKHQQESLGDEYEQWKRVPVLAEDDPRSYNPLLYWQLLSQQYPMLSKFAIDVLTIPASAADCELKQSGLKTSVLAGKSVLKYDLCDALAINQVRLRAPACQIGAAA